MRRSLVSVFVVLAVACSGTTAEPEATTTEPTTTTLTTATTEATTTTLATATTTITTSSTTTVATTAPTTSTTAAATTTTTTASPATTTTTIPATTTTTPPTTTTVQPNDLRITIANFAFSGDASGSVNDTVTVTNSDSVAHTWTSTTGAFDSGQLGGGATFSFTFGAAGTFAYFCQIHPSMTGSIAISP